MNLITYRCVNHQGETWGYDITGYPADWVIDMQKHAGETYYIVNVLPVTDEWAAEWDGKLKGQ